MSKQAEDRLAAAMEKLSDALEKVASPDTWRVVSEILNARLQGVMTAPLRGLVMPTLPALPVGIPQQLQISLTPEERAAMVAAVMEAVTPHLAEFREYVSQSVAELPAVELKRAVDLIAAGHKPQLRRAQGCIFLSYPGEEEIYLRL